MASKAGQVLALLERSMSQSPMSQSTRLQSARSQQLAQRSRLLPGLLFLVVVHYGVAVSDRRLGAQEVTAAEAVRALEALTVDTLSLIHISEPTRPY